MWVARSNVARRADLTKFLTGEVETSAKIGQIIPEPVTTRFFVAQKCAFSLAAPRHATHDDTGAWMTARRRGWCQ